MFICTTSSQSVSSGTSGVESAYLLLRSISCDRLCPLHMELARSVRVLGDRKTLMRSETVRVTMLDAIPTVSNQFESDGSILVRQNWMGIAFFPLGPLLPSINAILARRDVPIVPILLAHMIEMIVAIAIHVSSIPLPTHAPSQRPLATEVPTRENRPSTGRLNRCAIFSAANVRLVSGRLRVAQFVTPMVQHTVSITIFCVCVACIASAES